MDSTGLTSRLAGEITSLILAGDLPVDAKVNTQQLAERFSVSRTPVRAALDLLEEQGVVRQETNRGYFVAPLSTQARARALKGSSPASSFSAARR